MKQRMLHGHAVPVHQCNHLIDFDEIWQEKNRQHNFDKI
jgi:hypothetical protein